MTLIGNYTAGIGDRQRECSDGGQPAAAVCVLWVPGTDEVLGVQGMVLRQCVPGR